MCLHLPSTFAAHAPAPRLRRLLPPPAAPQQTTLRRQQHHCRCHRRTHPGVLQAVLSQRCPQLAGTLQLVKPKALLQQRQRGRYHISQMLLSCQCSISKTGTFRSCLQIRLMELQTPRGLGSYTRKSLLVTTPDGCPVACEFAKAAASCCASSCAICGGGMPAFQPNGQA